MTWRTTLEQGNVGFIVYRARRATPRQRKRLLPQMVAGTVLDLGKTQRSRRARDYRHYDPSGHRGDRYFVRSVNVAGRSRLHGPYVVAGKRVAPGHDSALLQPTAVPQQTTTTPPANTTPVVQAGPPVPTATPAPTVAPDTPTPQAQAQLASRQTVRLGVDRTGWTSIGLDILKNRGIDTSVPANLHLFTGGREVAALVRNGALEFYGRAVDTNDTATRAYFVEAQTGPGLRIPTVRAKADDTGQSSFTTKAVNDGRSIYFSGLLNGDSSNFFGGVVTSSGANVTVTAPHVQSPTQAASLTVSIQGVTTNAHSVSVALNGDPVGTVTFDGQSLVTRTFDIPGVGEGNNTVRLATGDSGDVVLNGSIALQYDHAMLADGDSLALPAPGGTPATIGGFSRGGVRIVDVTDPDHPIELDATNADGSARASVPGSGPHRLLAFTPDTVQGPATVDTGRPATLADAGHSGTLTIITPATYEAAFQPLVDQRRAEGLSVAVVDLQDIYDEFSYGQADHQAITTFLNTARNAWAAPPKYILLGGDATYDPRGFEGATDGNVVPTAMIDASLETASDSTLTGTLATGRFPVRSPAQLSALVSKTLAYGTQPSTSSALLASDVDQTWDFTGSSAALGPLLPQNWARTGLRRSQPTARADLLAALDAGPSVVNYAGHGSVGIWAGNLLKNTDAVNIENSGKLSFFVFMTCLNGYFISPKIESMAEALVKAPNAGVAVFSSTSTTTPGPQEAANQALFRALFGGPTAPRLGDAVVASLSAAGDGDVRRTWTLMGDPTLVIH